MNSQIILMMLVVWLPPLFPGCAPINPAGYDENDKGPPIQTEKEAYVVSRIGHGLEVSIKVIYTNRTGRTVYLPTCIVVHPPLLEKRVDGKWALAYAAIVPLCIGPPVQIKSATTYSYIFNMHARLPTDEAPRFLPETVDGTYRLVWEIYETWTPDKYPLGKLLSLEQRVSNEFKLSE
jgi:hypothetical protein